MPKKKELTLVSFIKIATFLTLTFLGALFYYYDLQRYCNLEYLRTQAPTFSENYQQNPIKISLIFVGVYVLLAGFSVPGTVIFTLLAGFLFPIWLGIFLSLLASTMGATMAVVITRFIYQNLIRQKFPNIYKKMHDYLKNDYNIYLFALRMSPIFPFFIVNYFFSVTTMPIRPFFFVSLLGMLPTTIIYVTMGKKLGEISSETKILNVPTLLFLTFLSFSIILGNHLLKKYKKSTSISQKK